MSTIETTESIQAGIIELLPRLRRFARNLTRNPHDADDVVQLAIERALTRLDQWHRDARLDSWLFKIVRNAWIDELRSKRRRDGLFAPEEAGVAVGVDSMAQEATRLSVEAAMARLPEDQRLAVSAATLDEPVPDRLLAAVREGPTPLTPVASLTERHAHRHARQAAARLSWLLGGRALGSLAAGLVLGIGIGYVVAHRSEPLLRTADGEVEAAGTLAAALSTQLSVDRGATRVATIGLTFRAKSGGYCRTFTLTGGARASGLACRDDGRWRIDLLTPASSPDLSDYRTAGSAESPPLRALIESDMAGEPLTTADEMAARSAGWAGTSK